MRLISALVVVVVYLCCGINAGVCPWYESDAKNWWEATTWPSGKVPVAGDDVVIPAGTKVRYDIAVRTLFNSVTLDTGSQLVFDGAQSNVFMDTNYIYVKEKAALRVGGVDCAYSNKATITLYGPRDLNTSVVPFMGNKGIISAGTIAFYGYAPTNTWTRITNTVAQYSTSFTVKDDITGWKVGDSIVMATTDYYEWMNEQFTIKAISGRNITVDRPVSYLHWGANDEFAEVGLLTRNIVVQGDNSSDASLYGGHTLVYGNGTGKIQGVEFTRMGQANVLARYPMHYHFQGDQSNSGSFVRGCSFRNNYQRCLTVHGTSGIRVDKNVGFNITGHCYFLEEGSETNNTYTNNLAIYMKQGTMIPSDAKPSAFWITNPNNTFINNTGVGAYFAFWYSLPYNPVGMSSKMTTIFPQSTPLGRFDNNVGHSNVLNGLQVDECLSTDPYNPDCRYTPSTRATFSNFYAWKNRQYGVWIRGISITVDNAYLVDNGIGINVPISATLISNTLIIGETPNGGMTWMTKGWDDKGRSRPKLFAYNFPIHGLEVYDASGNQFARNVTMKNFFTDSVRKAGAIGAIANGYYILQPSDIITQVNLPDGSNEFIMEGNYGDYDAPKHIVINDGDGSWTGDYGGTLVGTSALLRYESNCTYMPQWNGFYKCKKNENGYSHMTVLNTNTSNVNYGASFNMTYRANITALGYPDSATPIKGIDPRQTIRLQYAANVYSRKAYLYTFPHPTPPQLQLNMRGASSGEWVVAVFSYPNTATFKVTRGYYKSPIASGNSLSDLSVSTYYYDNVNQYLYVMYVEDDGLLTGPTGFPQYGYGYLYIDITASCGKECTVTATQSLPPALPDNEDKYRATLKGCNAGTNSSYEGIAYFSFNTKTKQATYVIYHNLPIATSAVLVGERNGMIVNFTVPQSPLKGIINLSYLKWNELWAGEWTITIQNGSPLNTIKGTLGCSGLCATPPLTATWDPCVSDAPYEMPIYEDALNDKDAWINWSWSNLVNFNYTGDTRCGSRAIYANYTSWGALSLHLSGACAPGACTDLTWQKPFVNITYYKYFEFYVKSPAGPMSFPLTIQVQDSTDKVVGSTLLGLRHIDNFILDNVWTRVRVPLKDMSLKGNELIGTFGILMNTNLPTKTWVLLFDNIKLVSEYDDLVIKPPYGTLKAWNTSC